MTSPDDQLLQFAGSSFNSVWALELLLVLKREPRAWPKQELVATLRASDLVVSKAVNSLLAAGFVSIEGENVVYLPVSEDVGVTIDAVEKLYAARPNSVRRAIVGRDRGAASAFADAFKLRKD